MWLRIRNLLRLGKGGRWGGLCAFLLLAGLTETLAQPAVYQFRHAHIKRARLPFLLQRNLIIIEVLLNGKGPYNFLLDTGISSSLITDPRLGQELGLRTEGRFLVAGAGEESPLEAYQVNNVAVELADGVKAPQASFLLLSNDVLNLSGYVGMPIHGLLGSDVFRSFVVEIEPIQQQLIFHDPAFYKAPHGRRWARLGLDMEGRKSYLTVPLQLSASLAMPAKLVLDTGAGHALSLETSSDPRLKLPPAHLRTQLGRGLNGNINGYLGRVSALQLGRYRIPSLLTSFPDSTEVALRAETPRNGNLGFELLKRFTVIIDYRHNQLLLRPNSTFSDPFEHDMCGFDVLAFGSQYRQYRLLRVEAGSPADQAGLQSGDEIMSINLLPAEFFNLNQMSRMLHSENGRQLLFVVRRPDGELFTATVRLKRQI